ncbi:hypothetical protein M406DRAFT_330200 [Cryphonectria parasitica EP155]|uniref:Uncharacterized protein n=1 Tax=Cryphonectria parasitica (strain ATCC 38755 / EP155) TaxID=660469 RepID=A0A9P4Y4K9_CRYP1|nr:uncharacterized protein M406DRAFT_330200 [Cryphonectria parasitica EP155]KAF3766375.1 hypothetical protein M406DRAFT_330200 [Cryphonectria parasitica EP155]
MADTQMTSAAKYALRKMVEKLRADGVTLKEMHTELRAVFPKITFTDVCNELLSSSLAQPQSTNHTTFVRSAAGHHPASVEQYFNNNTADNETDGLWDMTNTRDMYLPSEKGSTCLSDNEWYQNSDYASLAPSDSASCIVTKTARVQRMNETIKYGTTMFIELNMEPVIKRNGEENFFGLTPFYDLEAEGCEPTCRCYEC